MQQVMYANGKLWGALDTALNPDGGAAACRHRLLHRQSEPGKLDHAGLLGAAGHDFTYPAIGGHGERPRRDSLHGDRATHVTQVRHYASIDAKVGVGPWAFVDPGGRAQRTDDGFTSYKSQVGNPPRTRWGDYGAAAVDGNSIWIASEYIADPCSYTEWGGPFFVGGTGDNLLGTCAGSPGANRNPRRPRQLGDANQQVDALTLMGRIER